MPAALLLQTLKVTDPLGLAHRPVRLRHTGTLQSLGSPIHDGVVHDPQLAEMVDDDTRGQRVRESREEQREELVGIRPHNEHDHVIDVSQQPLSLLPLDGLIRPKVARTLD
jgi:hypothetical protein